MAMTVMACIRMALESDNAYQKEARAKRAFYLQVVSITVLRQRLAHGPLCSIVTNHAIFKYRQCEP